jgi:sulfite exporter TauE/SafE/copper chaperone CopZ
MTCVNCRNRIEKQLKSTVGVEDAAVNFSTESATVTYNASIITFSEIAAAVEKLDYQVLDGGTGKRRGPGAAGVLLIIASLYILLRMLRLDTLAAAFPLAEAGMGYGMLFVIGLITSVHCAAMCGGISLSQCLPSEPDGPAGETPAAGKVRKALAPAILYNTGRVLSYTAVGAAAGALGSVITLPGRFQGTVQLAAGVFMVILGINMLGLFPFLRRLIPGAPKIVTRKLEALTGGGGKRAARRPLFIGLLNGLMPCGPLQAMQLYALSTGNPLSGGFSMLLFSLGTVPLMFGTGALSTFLSASGGRVFRRRVTQAGAVLITVMGMLMFSYGFNLSGLGNPLEGLSFAGGSAGYSGEGVSGAAASSASPAGTTAAAAGANGAFTPVIDRGVQIVNSTLSAGRYPAITVLQGVPVRWTINAPPGSINGCNNRMLIREYGIEHQFKSGENVIEFTPSRTGKFSYSCWMGMIRSSITVVAEGAVIAGEEPGQAPVPAGVSIAADALALAEIAGDGSYQTVGINLRDDGIDPAIIVVQRGIPAYWIIHNDSLEPGNRQLFFPAYYTRFDMVQGDNEIGFMPLEDFDFSTADSVFYGYVKVVEDLGTADPEAIKAEAAEYETLIYPEAYFDPPGPGMIICRE